MTHNLYALLVGINEYDRRSQVSSLRGCTNDAKAMKAYLESQSGDKTQLHTSVLLNEQATRQAVVDGFREHLQQAEAGDTVLFYYAGHGSQNRAPEEFWPIMPSRLNETLVCHDSRVPGSWDLADKELSKLIAEVSAKNPHIVIVLDCCHSGSGTRGDRDLSAAPVFATRRAAADERDRPASSFLISARELAKAEQIQAEKMPAIARSFNASGAGWNLPQGRHVLMAACRDTEEASEYRAHGEPCGAFSHFLLDTLQKTNSPLTYRDLFNATAAKIRANVSDQAPQLEASQLEDLEQPFLGGLVEPFPSYFTLTYSSELGWCINGGALHGIQSLANGEKTQLALFSIEAQSEDLHQLEGAIARATVTEVQPHLSRITTESKLNPSSTYKAIVTYLPIPPLSVVLEGDASSLEKLRQAMQTSTAVAAPSSYLKEVTEAASAKIRVVASPSAYVVAHVQPSLRAIATVEAASKSTVGGADTVVRLLAHIARWTGITDSAPPPGNQLPANAVELQIYHEDRLLETEQIQLAYEQKGQQWQAPSFKAKLINNSDRPLYCALLNLTEEYSVSAPFFISGGVWLDARRQVWVTISTSTQLSDLIPTTVPQSLWEQGVCEYQDRLKLIASTTEFDPLVLLQNKIQNKIDCAGTTVNRSIAASQNNLFRQFASQTSSRDIGVDEAAATVDQWMTSQRFITTMRPQTDMQVSMNQPVSLTAADSSTEQITIQPHAQLKAKVRLASATQGTRAIDMPNLPLLLKEHTQPLLFTAHRGLIPSLNALEMREVSGAESVTPDNPLTLIVDAPLADGESVLPVAYDGEFFIPLGYGRRRGEQTEVVLQRIPQMSELEASSGSDTRSISSSLKIVFRKVAKQALGETLSQKLGVSFEYPILAAVEQEHKPESRQSDWVYKTDTGDIRDRVTKAKNIAIYIHGITDSTQSMMPSLQTACIDVSGQAYTVSELYDLVLIYDYESLNTSITTSALQLKQKLAAVGLLPGHNKTVHIVAHSMGGLVSRWFIEKEGGSEIVQHLTMLGTPNAGSPWPVVQAGVFKALSFAINGLTTVAWPLQLVNGALAALEAVDVALDEMTPGSELLKQLAEGEPPIPYSIVAGNTSLVPFDEKAALRSRLERRLGQLTELPFFQEDNDIAASVSSIRHVRLSKAHAPKVREVACNHLVYFVDPAGLAGLSWAVNRAFALTQKQLQASNR